MVEPYPNIISYNNKPKNDNKGMQVIELVDNMEIPEKLKETMLLPYLKSIYESLILRTNEKDKGLPLYAFVEVIILIIF